MISFFVKVGWYFARILVCIVLLLSAFTHLNAPYLYLETILNYDLLPDGLVPTFAAFTPSLHIAIVAAITTGRFKSSGFLLSTMIFVVYFLAQTITLARGLKIGCGCFGPSNDVVGIGSISMVLSLVLLSASLFHKSRKEVVG